MLKYRYSLLILCFLLSTPLFIHSTQIFPYEYTVDYTIVRSGSRNEIEPGKSGFAHFFEHIMFKGTKDVPREAYDDFLTQLGAGTNGYTSDDYTCYYVVFAGRENLESVVKTEADRFINLYYDEEMIKTEAPVIEGEYYASVSNPGRRLSELLRNTAFENHSYKHTTMGYLDDILDMPNQFEYSQLYKQRFYAPDNSILLVAGDFDHTQLMEYVNKYYSSWKKSGYTLVTPEEPPQTKAKRAHLDWPSSTLPRLVIGFHGPGYSEENIDKAALDLLGEVAFTSRSLLYQRLVVGEQKCRSFYPSFPDRRDPHLLTFNAVVKNEKDLAYVEAEIFKEIERIKTELLSEDTLADIKSNMKYSFANALATTDGIAGTLAFYINLTSDPGTVNKHFELYEKVTPQDMQDAANKYLNQANSTVVTLTGGKGQ